jgi:CubicO group peptidase (beta-lactamase class C family)
MNVIDFFPEMEFDNMDSRKSSMTIEHLLTMTHGLDWEENNDYFPMTISDNWVQFVLDRPMIRDPGSVMEYCSGAPHVLSAIIERVSGNSTLEFAEEYLFEPLRVDDYNWETDPQGIYEGARGLSLTPHDMAKFGYLFLNNGTWDTEQIVSPDWISMSRDGQHYVNLIKRYGYGWWNYTGVGAYNAVGFTAQVISVVPEHDLVVVVTGRDGTGDFMRTQFRQTLLQWIIPAAEDDVGPTIPDDAGPDVLPLILGAGGVIAILVAIVLIRRRT